MVSRVTKDGGAPPPKTHHSQKKPKLPFQNFLEKKQPISHSSKRSIFDPPSRKKESPQRKEKTKKQVKEKPKEQASSPYVYEQENQTVYEQGNPTIEMRSTCPEAEVSYTVELSPAMHDLVNQMDNYITLESNNGISTIELQVETADPHSLFQGTTVRIDHYDTHPHSFNIQLSSAIAPAVEELTAHLPSLLKALQSKLENFQIHLLPPAYSKQPTSKSIKKVGKSSKEEKKEEGKTRKIERNPFLN